MAVRFKFRSSATFDSIDIGEQSSISIRDLKSEIVKRKHLNLSQDFDLVFSDFASGQEYKDENVRVPSGSSVIIKRVPATTSTPLLRAGDVTDMCFGGREANLVNIVEPPAAIDETTAFDDFGTDLSPLPNAKLPDHGKLQSNNSETKNDMAPRCSEELLVSFHKVVATHQFQSARKDSSANDGSTLVMQSKPIHEEQMQLQRTFTANQLAMDGSDMPSELKCSLCRNFFKEAVMIPCCQRSFCEKCIRLSLSENSRCPMCSSTKCKADDLLPNVSLRQAIEHFLESQLLRNGSENDLNRYAPDGESGIQVKELSYAPTVTQRNLQLNRCATGKWSNQIMQNKLHGHAHVSDTQCKQGAVEDSTEFEGENDPQNMVRTDEEDTCTKKVGGFHVNNEGDDTNFTTPGRLKRGQRTCYMCGSPDHFIRDCPIASSRTNQWSGDASYVGSAPGCAPPYWPGNPQNIRPFVNMYGGSGMLYNNTMPPVTSFIYPPYAPSMYAAYPVSSGNMALGAGCIAPPSGSNGPHPRYAEVMQARENQQRAYNGDFGRGRTAPVHECGMQRDNMERGMNHSDENLAKRSEGKQRNRNHSDDDAYSFGERQEKISRKDGGRDLRAFRSDRSTSEKDMSGCGIHPREDRHEKHQRNSRKNDETAVRYDRDPKRESTKMRRMEHDHRPDREFHSHSRSSMEHSYSNDSGRQRREESSHRSRHPKKISKSNEKELHHSRDRMTKYSDDDHGEYYHGHKRKRFH